jgi:hypothetical protein
LSVSVPCLSPLTAAGDKAFGRLTSRMLFHFGTIEGKWLMDP